MNRAKRGEELRLLRCRHTQRYFTGQSWSPDLSEAISFPNALDAFRTSLQKGFEDVEYVLWDPDTSSDIFSLPLR